MKRILSLYIIREISSLFLLGISIFTLILLMGRLIKLTELVVSRGVPLLDVGRMILYLMPSFLVFTIPMAFLLAVLLAFGRFSADNEITVLKACGISLVQMLPPVFVCALIATLFALAASTIGVPWGNSAFKNLTIKVLKQNAAATIREKVFWDEIPGIMLYTDAFDAKLNRLQGIVIHDGRNPERPMTIFAREGVLEGGGPQSSLRVSLDNGTIHAAGARGEYRLIHFEEYIMTVGHQGGGAGGGRNELDMWISELQQQISSPAVTVQNRLKMLSELHSRFAFPCASLVFVFIAVPMGIQNRRSGKSAGFSASIGLLLTYYVLMSIARTLAEKGVLPAAMALWIPNIVFCLFGWMLLRLVSLERSFPVPTFNGLRALLRVKS
ncbi:MAG TPA: LPS export ABC transporter permease LptF [Desulfuromonadales bacterium]|nr:LPS export ABC transporter permease LptF [Desulfuromonadales bacterium]